MKKISLALVCFAVALDGCGRGLKAKVVGSWKIDTPSVKSAFLDQLLASKGYREMIQKSMASSVYTFKSDGTFTLSSAVVTASQTGKWTLDGKALKLTIDNQPASAEVPKFTVNSDGMRIHVSAGSPRPIEMDLIKKTG